MLRRAALSGVRSVPVARQRRGCVDKWYGHVIDIVPIYDWSDEDPHEAHKGRTRSAVETQLEVKSLPKVEFCTSWEVDNQERPRYWFNDQNPPIYDFWVPSRLELRLNREVDKNVVSRASREIPGGATDEEKDKMMNDIHEEELVSKDDRMQRAKKVNHFAHNNMRDILPDPMREKIRLDIYEDLHLHDRQEIRGILREWVPHKYRLDAAPDGRKMAIDSPKHRQKFLEAIEKVKASFASEATGNKAAALEEQTFFYRHQYDPFPQISKEAINKCTDLNTLHNMARSLFYYNGDILILSIWKRAGELQNRPDITKWADCTRSEYLDPSQDFSQEEREFFNMFQKVIPLTEKEFLTKQMAENPVLEETLKHSSDIHILEEIEAFYNEHIDAEKDIVEVIVSGQEPAAIVAELIQIEAQSNAHFIAVRKYKTLASEVHILSEQNPGIYSSFKDKLHAMGKHHPQDVAPFEAKVILGLRIFESLLLCEGHFPIEEATDNYSLGVSRWTDFSSGDRWYSTYYKKTRS